MNNEILEISHWLHEKGFEPDMWTSATMSDGRYFFTDEPTGESWMDIPYTFNQPYFTLNRVLELLPKIVSFDELTSAVGYEAGLRLDITDEHNCIGFGYFCCEYHCYIKDFFIEVEGSYHLAALRLLKKTVEEGYVKAN